VYHISHLPRIISSTLLIKVTYLWHTNYVWR